MAQSAGTGMSALAPLFGLREADVSAEGSLCSYSTPLSHQKAIQIPTMMTVIDTMITVVSIEGHQRMRCSSMGSPFNDDGHFARVCS